MLMLFYQGVKTYGAFVFVALGLFICIGKMPLACNFISFNTFIPISNELYDGPNGSLFISILLHNSKF